MPKEISKLVYSTDHAVLRAEKPVEKALQANTPAAQQKVTVRVDRKGRGGKTVTIVDGLQIPQKKMEELLKQFKMKLGTGGTIRDTSLEIHGDHRDVLIPALEKMGYAPKRSGG